MLVLRGVCCVRCTTHTSRWYPLFGLFWFHIVQHHNEGPTEGKRSGAAGRLSVCRIEAPPGGSCVSSVWLAPVCCAAERDHTCIVHCRCDILIISLVLCGGAANCRPHSCLFGLRDGNKARMEILHARNALPYIASTCLLLRQARTRQMCTWRMRRCVAWSAWLCLCLCCSAVCVGGVCAILGPMRQL